VQESNLDDDTPWITRREQPEYSLIKNEIKILKQGLLLRRGVFRKNAWKLGLFVVTETGYIHCFNYQTSEELERRKTLSKIAGEEIPDQYVYNNLLKPKTFFRYGNPKHFLIIASLPLKGSKIAVDFVQDTKDINVFQLVFTKEEGMFKSKIVQDTFLIKAASEEEMIEWVAVLKNKIQYGFDVRLIRRSYLPDRPPEPLFKTANELNEAVEISQVTQDITFTTTNKDTLKDMTVVENEKEKESEKIKPMSRASTMNGISRKKPELSGRLSLKKPPPIPDDSSSKTLEADLEEAFQDALSAL
jgi:hypothetical protein